MSETDAHRPAFTLRFSNEATHRNLRLTAQALGVSMNELAEAAMEHELAVVGADLEQKLTRAAELLRSYRQQGIDKDVDDFARAEVTVEDPLRSSRSTLELGPECGGQQCKTRYFMESGSRQGSSSMSSRQSGPRASGCDLLGRDL